jgi:acetylornithine deacetylase/succinyl-diaminopimelate desuccinylase-like protein
VNSKLKSNRLKGAAGAAIKQKILADVRSAELRGDVEKLLVELCKIDTISNPDPGRMAEAEGRSFDVLERELRGLAFDGGRWERRPVNPDIQTHRHYSLLHFTKTPDRPLGLSAEETYAGRSNLVYIAPGTDGKAAGVSVALNAHVDVVAPYFPPRMKAGVIHGRGACDDKGPLVAMVAALKVLSRVMARTGLKWNRNVVAMFVVEEETGGNGSLSLAMDRGLKELYDSVVIGEPTSLKIHPANRGAVWYRAELRPPEGVSAFEMSAFVVEELEKEGRAIRAESRHELFPQRPVQTCHGIIGPFGEHPSRICGEAGFTVRFQRRPGAEAEALVRDCLDGGLAEYVGLYGDKTKVVDPATGQPMVARHYHLKRSGDGFAVTVYGATGHMGAVRQRDGAITKMAQLVRSLVLSAGKLSELGGPVRFELGGGFNEKGLVMEGGQGFVPTHTIEEVMERLRRAAVRGAENHLRRCGCAESGAEAVTVTFEKLHNAAFDGDPDSAAMRNAIAAAKECKIWQDEPVAGWTVSCDARLFATEYPGMPVLTFGPGELAFAHSDQEQIEVTDILKAVEFLALYLLRQTGTLL